MAKLLTNREMELFKTALYWMNKHENASLENPNLDRDRFALAKELADGLSFNIDEDDLAEICEQVSGQ